MEYKKLPMSLTQSHCTRIITAACAVFVLLSFGGVFYELISLKNQLEEVKKELRVIKPQLQLHEQALFLQESIIQDIGVLIPKKNKTQSSKDDFEHDTGASTQSPKDDFQYDTGDSNMLYFDDDDYNYEYDYGYPTKLPLKDLVTDHSDTQTLRSKRDVLRRTLDGIPVNAESYEDVKRRNKTLKELNKPDKSIPSPRRNGSKSVVDSPQPPATYSRRSRVFRFEDKSKAFRKIVTKSLLKSADTLEQSSSEVPVGHHKRRHRQRRVGSSERFYRFRPAIHLSGNVYDGNGWAHHNSHHYKNWTGESWVTNLGMEEYFKMDNGYLRITEPGLYLIYAQVMYYDEHDTNGYAVFKNEDIVLQCTTTSHTTHRVRKSNTCFTAGVSYLSDGDRLKVHDLEPYRFSIFRPGKSFFGAVKLTDIKMTTTT